MNVTGFLKNRERLGGHKAWHRNNAKCLRPLIDFNDLKRDRSRKFRLIQERGYRCEICKLDKWLGKDIPLELDHIDGHPENNDKSNFRVICPNCHAQTPYYKGANAGRNKDTLRQKTLAKYKNKRLR